MENQSQKKDMNLLFDQKAADSYDQRTVVWAAGRQSLHDLTRVILGELPAKARILCVGVGTGIEMVALAEAFPEWRFTAVEPSRAMLEVCRQRARENGIESRCTFHGGYLDSLPASEPFEAATCLLVSHFFMVPEERSAFFGEIAVRLRVGGILVSSDLASDMASEEYRSLLDVWVRMMKSPAMSDEDIEKWRSSYGRDAAVLPSREVEGIIKAGGFETSVLFFQNLLIHAWYSKKSAI